MFEILAYEYSCRYRIIRREDGRPGALNWRYFPTASACLSFLASFDAPEARQMFALTVSRRPLGAWHSLDRHELEAFAAEEGGRE